MDIKKRYCNVQLTLEHKSAERIKRFLTKNSNVIYEQKFGFHTTVHYSEEIPIFPRQPVLENIRKLLPIKLSPDTYRIDVFGEDVLVLRYESETIEKVNWMIINEGLRQCICEWPDRLSDEELQRLRESPFIRKSPVYLDFNPHITLARNFDIENLEKIGCLEESITFDNFKWIL